VETVRAFSTGSKCIEKVIFCCFQENDLRIYKSLLHGDSTAE